MNNKKLFFLVTIVFLLLELKKLTITISLFLQYLIKVPQSEHLLPLHSISIFNVQVTTTVFFFYSCVRI